MKLLTRRRARAERLRHEGMELARIAFLAGGDLQSWFKELAHKWASESAHRHALAGFEEGLRFRGTPSQILLFEMWKAGREKEEKAKAP